MSVVHNPPPPTTTWSPQTDAPMTGAALLIRTLLDLGVDTVFGYTRQRPVHTSQLRRHLAGAGEL